MKSKILLVALLSIGISAFAQKRHTLKTFEGLKHLKKSRTFPAGATLDAAKKSKLDSMVLEYFDRDKMAWGIESKYIVKYDGECRAVQLENFDGSPSGVPNLSGRGSYEYNPAGQLVKMTWEDYNRTSSTWSYDYRSEFAYNSNGQLITETDKLYDTLTKTWVNDWKTETVYNQDGKVKEENEFYWDEDLNKWFHFYRTLYHYDGNEVTLTSEEYDEDLNKWEYSEQIVRVYNPLKLVLETIYERNVGMGIWDLYSRTQNSYNAKGDIISSETEYWDDDGDKWEKSKKEEFAANENFLFEESCIPHELSDYENYFNHQWKTWSMFGMEMNNWFQYGRGNLYYSNFTASVSSLNHKNNFTVYPNPSKDYITLEVKELSGEISLSIVNTLGATVKQVSLDSNSLIPVSDLPSGIYFLNVMKNGTLSGQSKFIKL